MSSLIRKMSPAGDADGDRLSDHPEGLPLSVHDLTVAYQRKPVLWDIDLDLSLIHI